MIRILQLQSVQIIMKVTSKRLLVQYLLYKHRHSHTIIETEVHDQPFAKRMNLTENSKTLLLADESKNTFLCKQKCQTKMQCATITNGFSILFCRIHDSLVKKNLLSRCSVCRYFLWTKEENELWSFFVFAPGRQHFECISSKKFNLILTRIFFST